MQGRLVDCINGKVQAFPEIDWRREFVIANEINFSLIEWTLDQHNLSTNPFVTIEGRSEIKELCNKYSIKIESVTGDLFMQYPFWKIPEERKILLESLDLVFESAAALKLKYIIVPLVDNGRLEHNSQKEVLIDELMKRHTWLLKNNIKVIFESDLDPESFTSFIDLLPDDSFGVNYDIGNSASLGFDPLVEFNAYGKRIYNVHVKDRLYRGGTVPLGTGVADFKKVAKALHAIGYKYNFILQTARAYNGLHAESLISYRKFFQEYIET
jgi:L-ribulose-5-phosphate 3-epimerase